MATESKTEGKGDDLKGKARTRGGDITCDEDEKATGEGSQAKAASSRRQATLRTRFRTRQE
jgi:uncharacterized protein YjbJ (UPF0337 family)